ncbi:Glucose-6-phosphate isomerase [Thalassovita gelatinovora]|uniref:Glucose-6-phosphate isomerase n=1 Tax=Thalassovita gelatinovora TaxID=53501 RepID=A0A0P1FQ63_THAGE|nr:glucose-6-phosphate isomerase [Thalassovita gelatinovora]QIZ79390.1 glucose-6-phosphate isomerase [Thalassovita gelatinovora]CUH62711.1 Glucose-6-phosphate isomerase [Thalassovita gelatinovora]SEQ08897.1 glucose-6-phosphate isomerase [Thalassovita gelatinovora]
MNFKDLAELAADAKDRPILSLFETPGRATQFSRRFDGLYFDFSKTNIDDKTMSALLSLAQNTDVAAKRDAMFSGALINETEGRAVLHSALRAPDSVEIRVDGEDVMPGVVATRNRMADFTKDVRSGTFTGQGGRITDVVNIGIGGSDLGPVMGVKALSSYHDGPKIHFVSNVDGAHIADTLADLNPETTLVIVASKTFNTIETMTNATTARDWMAKAVSTPGDQFAALSTADDKTAEFGIAPERVFGFEDWVGGRYSMWGPIGLSLMIAIGPDRFMEFLHGGAAMDAHFRQAPLADNLPVLLALVGIWHHQGMGYATRAVLPYEQRLERLPAYLQQLEMESNGKRVAMDGSDLQTASGPVVWGEPGTNGQHAFYQLIHQGTAIVPCEFMIGAKGHEPELDHHHRLLVANCLAQSEALLKGRSLEKARELMAAKGFKDGELERQARHRVFPGNRPSTTLVYDLLTPYRLGQIIALYEHRVFVEGVILGLNSFDQWGVELGKELAIALQPVLDGKASAEGKDGSTRALIDVIQSA